ncbi:putative integral membrane protein [Leishmania donovani]|uniref:Putative integral membrane protein n=1 Tax=Leishmania donovani TaxID=5661 RepID=A0A504XZ21_LEIDO|nr:putative integral membrane protein [Leishmania donovani]
MSAFDFRSSPHKRGAAAVLLLFAIAAVAPLTVSAQAIDDYPPVACDSTVPNCLECRKVGMLSLCSNCKEGYSTAVSPMTPTEFGKCKPYDPSTCRLDNCLRCAADDNTKCVQCPVGYPNINTYLCDGTTAAPTTAAPTTSDNLSPLHRLPGPSGMVLMASGQCMAAGSCSMTNCAQCYPNDSNRCSSCEPGYALTVSYTCIPRKSGNSAAAPTPVLAALVIVAVAATVAYVM